MALEKRMDINPDLVENIVLYNLLDEDFIDCYIETVSTISFYLAYREEKVGPFKQCCPRRSEPLLKLIIWAKSRDATINFETQLLIYGHDANSYWFYAGGRWRRCCDADDTGVKVLGPVREADFNSKKEGGFVVKEIGPGTMYEALKELDSENGNWEHHFRVLSFMFLDAARFNTVLDFVVKTFVEAADKSLTHKQTVDDVVAKCPAHWKILSKAMHNLFPDFSLNKLPVWYLPPPTVVDLKLPTAELDKELATVESDEDHTIEVERLKINQIAACMDMINVLCPHHLLEFDD